MKRIGSAVVVFVLFASIASAQMPGGAPPKNPSAALAKFLGKDLAFTATASVVTQKQSGRNPETTVMSFAVLEGKIRNEVDLTKMSGVKKQDAAGMKDMGMDRMVILTLPSKPVVYMIYPALESYYELPRSTNQTDGAGAKVERTELGSETIAKHPCTKTKVTVTEADGKISESLVWEATDLKKFPIQYQVAEGAETTTTTFQDINRDKPDASLFELPANYKQYGNMQQLIMGNMQRMMKQQ